VLLVLLALAGISLLAHADSYQSRQTGVWSAKTTWVTTTNLSGTITVSTATPTVTGSGTAFLTEYQVGDLVIRNNAAFTVIGTIASIESNTQLTLTANSSISASGITYRRGRVPGSADDVTVTGTNVTVTLDANVAVNSLSVTHLGGNNTTTTFDVSSLTLNVTGNVSVAGGSGNRFGRLQVGGGALTIGGNLSIANANATFDLGAGSNSTLNIAGSMTNSGTFTPGTSSTVNFNGTSAQTLPITGFTYANIRLNNAAGVTLGGAITATNVTGDIRVQSGIFSNNGNGIAGNAAKTFEVANGAIFQVTGTSAFPSNFTVSLGSSSNVEYTGTTQTVSAQTYGNLLLSGSGTKSSTASVTVVGTLTQSSSGTFSLGASLTVNKVNITAGTLQDNGNTITVTGTGANTWVMSGTFTTSGTTIFTGSAPEIGSSNFATLQIDIGAANTAIATGALSMTNFTLTSGTFNPGAFSHTISTNFTLATGTRLLVTQTTFGGNYSKNPTTVSGGSTVEYQATGSTIANFTYSNLTISGTVTGASTATVGGVFNVTGSFTPSGGTITFTDGASITNSGTATFSSLTIDNGATVTTSSSFGVLGTLSVGTGGNFTPSGSSTVTVNGGTITNAGTLSFQNLTLSATVTANTSYAVNGALSVSGTLNATVGTVTLGNLSTFTITSGSVSFFGLAISGSTTANQSYEVKGALTVTVSGVLNPTSGTVTVNGGSISNSGTLSFQNLTTAGTVTMNTSFTVKGSFTNNGTINQTSGVLTMSGGSSIGGTGGLTLHSLTIAGATTGTGNFTVNNVLTLNANLAMGSNVLTMGPSATTSGLFDVTGSVQRTSFALATEYTFGSAYTTLQFASATTLPTSVIVNTTVGSAPSGKSDAINRYYQITETGGTGYSATLRLRYKTGELNGNTETTLELWRDIGSGYANFGRSDINTSDKWVQRTNISALNAGWTLANKPTFLFTAGNSGDWNNPATWGQTGTPTEGVNYPGPVDSVTISDNFTVTLTANHSALAVTIQASNAAGTTLLDVDTYNLVIGAGGLSIVGGDADTKIARVRVAGGTLSVTGPITLTASSAPRAVLDISSGVSTLNVGGALTKSGTATFSAGTSSSVNFNGTSPQTIDVANFSFANVRVNNTHANGAALNAAVTTSNLSGNLRVLSGTLSNGGFAITGDPLKTFEVANGVTFILTGTSSFPTGFGTKTLGATSTVRYEGTTQTIAQESYGNLVIGGSGAKSVNSALTISGTLTHLASTTTLSGTSGDDLVVGKVVLTGGTLVDNGRTIMVTGTGAGTWDKSGGATFTSTGITVFTGAAPQIGASNFSTLQINVGSGNTATATGALTPANFTLTSGTFDPGAYTHTISTDLTLNSGSRLLVKTTTYGANYSRIPDTILSGSTIEYTATGSTVETINYYNLTISGTVTGSSTASVDGVFTVSNSFEPSGGTITLNNGASLVNSGTLTFSNLTIANAATATTSSSFSVGGTMSVGTGATFAPGGTVTLNGGATLSNAGSLVFQNLTLGGAVTANTSYTVNGTLAGGGTLDATSGTVTLGSGATISTSGSVSFFNLTVNGPVTANASYTVKGTLTVGASGNLNPTSGTVTLTNGSSATNSGVLSFFNLTISGTVSLNTSFTLKGTLTNSGTVNQTSGTLTTQTGAVISNTGTLELNNLTVSGATTGSNNFTVNGTLTLNATLAMGSNILTMGSSSATAGTGDVTGTVRRTSFTIGTPYTFGNQFTSINYTSASALPTSVDVAITIGSAPPEKSDAILRTYAITQSGGSSTVATLRLHYLDSELNANDESSLNLWLKSGSVYVDTGSTAFDITDNWVERSGLTALTTSWTLANFAPTGFIAVASGNWNAPATWGLSGTPQEGVNYPGPNDIANINGNFTVTVTTNQSVRKIVMQPTGTPKTARVNINEGLTMTVGTGGIVMTSNLNGRVAQINGPSVTLNVNGSISMSAGSTSDAVINLTGGSGVSTMNLKGSISRTDATSGTITFSSSGILNMNGTGGQTLDVRSCTFGNIHLNNTSSSGVELLGAITTTNVLGNLLVQSGIFNNSGYAIAGNTGKTFQLGAGTTFILGGTSSFPTGFTTSIDPTSTVNYSGGAQSVSDRAYGNLILGGTGSKTITSSISVANNFTYSSSATTSLSATSGHNLTTKTFTLTGGTFNDNGRTITVTGTNTQVWNKSGGTFNATGTVNITGAGAQIGASNFGSLNINVGIGNTATALGALTMSEFTLTTGTFDPGTALHTISSTFTIGDGTTLLVRNSSFGANYSSNPTTQSGSTVDYMNATASISNAFTYRNLKVSGSVTGGTNATVNEKFTVTGTFTPSSGKMIFNNGAEIINNGALTFRKLQITNGATVTSLSNFSINDSLIVGQNAVFQPTGTISFVTGGAIDVNPTVLNEGILTFNNLNVSAPVSTSSSFSVSGTMNVQANGEINPSAGKIVFTGGSSIVNSSVLSFYRVELTGPVTANTNFSVKDSLIIGPSGSLNQTSGSVTLENGAKVRNNGNLIFNSLSVTGTVTVDQSYSVTSSLNVGSGGNLTATVGTVSFSGGASISNTGTLSLNNVTIGSGTATANQGFAIAGTLTLNGDLAMGTNILDLGTTATITGLGDVTGYVRRAGTFSLSTSYTFGSQFTSITFASGTPPTSITVNVVKGSAPVEKPEAILRYNDISASGGGTYTATLRLRFLTGELNGNDPSTLSLWRKVGVSPYADSGRSANDLVNNWVEKSGLDGITGIWTLSRQNPGGFIAVQTGSWNNPATWGLSGTPTEGINYPGPSDIANIINNVTVTLTANQSALRVNVEGPTSDGTALLEVGAYTLTIGTGGLRLTGGTSDSRIAKVTVAGGTISVNGDVIFNTSSAVRSQLDLSLGSNSVLALTGAMTKNTAGTFVPGTTGVVNFTSTTGGQTLNVSAFTFSNIRVNNTGGGLAPDAAITTSNVTGDIRVQSGAFNNGGFAIAGNTGKTLEVANGATFNLTGTSSFPTGFTISLGTTSTVNYAGTGQTISNQSYGNLTLSGSGGHSISTALNVAGTFTYSSSGTTSLSSTAGHDLTTNKFLQTAGTFSDAGRTIIVTGSGSSTWSKTGGTFNATGIVRFTGSAPQIGASNFATLEIDVTGGNTASAIGSLTPTHLVLTSGTFDPGSSLHTIATNFTLASGSTLKVNTSTFAGNYSKSPTTVSSNSTVDYTSSTATLSNAFTYANLRVSGTVTGSSSPAVGGAFTVTGTFNNPGGTVTLNNGASIVVSGGTLNFSNLTVAAGDTATSASSFGVYGALSVGTGATFTPSGTVTMFGGSSISNSGSLTFGTLFVAGTITANTSYSVSQSLSIGLAGDLTATSGTVTMTGTSTISNLNALQLYTVVFSGTTTSSSNFSVAQSLSVGASGSFTASGGTVTMNGGSSIANSNSLTFYNVTTGSGTITSSSDFNVAGTLTVGAGSTFNPTGTITMNAGSAITISGSSSFNHLTIAGGTVTGNTNITVSGTLTLNGTFAMGSNILDLGVSTPLIAGTGDVTGNVRRQGTFVTGTAYSFGNRFTSINFASGSLTGSVTFNISIGSAPAEKLDAILRKYAVTESGISGYSATVRLHYLDSELNGNTASAMTLWYKSGSSYINQGRTGSVDETDKWVEKNSITALVGDWTLANQPAVGFTTVATGNWNDPATWGLTGTPTEGVNYPGPTDIANVTGGFTVTISATHSVLTLNVTGNTNGPAVLSVGAQSLTVNGNMTLTGGNTNARYARVNVAGGTLTVKGNITFSTGTAVRAVLDLSGAANSVLNIGGTMSKNTQGTFTPGTSSITNYNGTSAQTINVTNFTYAHLHTNNTSGSGASLGAAITATNVTGNLRVQSGIFSNAGFGVTGGAGDTIEVSSNAKLQLTGTTGFPTGFSTTTLASTSTVEYLGTTQSVANLPYGNLTLGGTGSKTIASALSVTGTFTYSSSASTSLSGTAGHDLTTGKFVLSNGTFVDNGRTILVTGTGSGVWNKSGGAFTATGIVRFTGAAPEISASNFGTLELNVGASGTAIATGIHTSDNLNLVTGTFDPGVYGHTIANNFTLANGTRILVRGAEFVTNYSKIPTSIGTAGVVEYVSSDAQTVNQTITYANLKLTGSGAKSAGGALTVTDSLIISNGSTLSGVSYNHQISGQWVNNGTYTASTGTVTFTGTAAQTIGGSSQTTFNNLAMNKSGGSLTLNLNTIVNGTLTLTSGNVTTGSFKLTMGPSATVSRTSGHIVGNFEKHIAAGPTSKTFEIGDASNYTPVTVAFANVTAAGYLTARTDAGDHPDILNSPVLDTESINRHWTVTNSGISFTSYSATFVFVAGDLDPAVNTSEMIMAKYDAGVWSEPTVVNRTPTSIEISGMTSFSQFQGGNPSRADFTSVTTGNWNSASTWDRNRVPKKNDNVTISASHVVTLTDNREITNVTVNANGEFAHNSGTTLSVYGDFVLNGTWSGSGTMSWKNDGNSITGSGTTSGTPVLQAEGNKDILASASLTLFRIHIFSGKTVTNNGTMTLTRLTGIDGTSTWTNATNSNLTVLQDLLTTGTLTATASGNTVTYGGNSAQTVKLTTYHHLAFSGSGTKTIGGSMSVQGNLIVNTGSPLLVNASGNLQVNGDFENGGFVTNDGIINVGN
jgi:hypothetical protein